MFARCYGNKGGQLLGSLCQDIQTGHFPKSWKMCCFPFFLREGDGKLCSTLVLADQMVCWPGTAKVKEGPPGANWIFSEFWYWHLIELKSKFWCTITHHLVLFQNWPNYYYSVRLVSRCHFRARFKETTVPKKIQLRFWNSWSFFCSLSVYHIYCLNTSFFGRSF